MNLMPIKPNPKSHTAKGHMGDLVKKLQYLLAEYETALNEKEIGACIIDARLHLRLDSEVK